MARLLPEGSLETVHQERDPVRPGEGLFTSGSMPRAVADRLLSTLRRYGALCRRYKARVRAVATSAVREAKNRDEIVARARKEACLNL
jgi:exopolyphosphatase / guanosine-5'-triphosphate,3'-diphosphate pyrophosphatase